MNHIMLDLETLGTGNNAAIVAIGACSFDPHGVDANRRCIGIPVSLASSMAHGLAADADTVLWWMQQSDAARTSAFPAEAAGLAQAVDAFDTWVREQGGDIPMWGNGATFDNVIIRSAYKAVGRTPPWSYKNDRCYRTLVNLLPESRRPAFDPYGTKHNALDDAIAQARHLQKVYKELGL